MDGACAKKWEWAAPTLGLRALPRPSCAFPALHARRRPRVGASQRSRGALAPTPTPRPRPRGVGRGSEPHRVREVPWPPRPLPARDRAACAPRVGASQRARSASALAPTPRPRPRGPFPGSDPTRPYPARHPLPTATSRRGQDMPRATRTGAGSWTGPARSGGSGRPRRSACGRRPGVRAEGRSLPACAKCLGPRTYSPPATARTVSWLRPDAALPCAPSPPHGHVASGPGHPESHMDRGG